MPYGNVFLYGIKIRDKNETERDETKHDENFAQL